MLPSSSGTRPERRREQFSREIPRQEVRIGGLNVGFRRDAPGGPISTAFVESTINEVVGRRFVKRQQMHWSLRGAHLLLQTRTKVLNNERDQLFARWYPGFRAEAA